MKTIPSPTFHANDLYYDCGSNSVWAKGFSESLQPTKQAAKLIELCNQHIESTDLLKVYLFPSFPSSDCIFPLMRFFNYIRRMSDTKKANLRIIWVNQWSDAVMQELGSDFKELFGDLTIQLISV